MAVITRGSETIQNEPLIHDSNGAKQLTGNMSIKSLVLTVLAFSAPMVAVSGYLPLAISVAGNGAPFAFLLTTLVMLIFVVGYLTLTKYIPKTGNFFLYITLGLGKKIGVGSAFVAIFSYILIMAGVYVFLGITFTELFEYLFKLQSPWWSWSIIAWVFVSILGHLNIEFSAKFMTTVMILEVLFIMAFNSSLLFSSDRAPLTVAPLLPNSLLDGNIVLPLLYGLMVYIGLEATTVYRDEVKNPNSTIPKATYISILFIGFLYTSACYFLMAAYGNTAYQVALDNPTGMFSDALVQYTGNTALQMKYALIVTSLIASLASINNVAARYIYCLGRDHILPKNLGAVHKKHNSPFSASIAVQVILVLVILPFLFMDKAPHVIYANMAGLGTAGVIALMALVSIAIIVWFYKNPQIKENPVKAYIFPALSTLIMGGISVFIFMNLEMVVGGEKADAWKFNLTLFSIFMAGMALAMYYQKIKPEIYKKIGF